MPKPRKHKRKRAKNQRAGCLMCKPWKINGAKRDLMAYRDKREFERIEQELAENSNSTYCT